MDSKTMMLNAYQGIKSDYIPCAPEFWFYYPAKVLGITMVEFQREVPHYKGMIAAFNKFGCEGWGIATPAEINPHIEVKSSLKRLDNGTYRDAQTVVCDGKAFSRSYIYSADEPFWSEEFAVSSAEDARAFFAATVNEDVKFDFSDAIKAHREVGGTFLLEMDLGLSFFDFFEQAMGFENALYYFMDEDEAVLRDMLDRYIAFKSRLVREAVEKTSYESYFIGCSSSCVALLGPALWRKWDKVYEKAITDVCHAGKRLMHNHNHGRVMEIVSDFVDIGFDCVCPFERPPGNVDGVEGIKAVRKLLQEKVTFNGNVHTVRALLQGTPETVRQQVRELKEAYAGSNRLIVGTGDQVAFDTPDENLWAMIEETRK